MNWQNTVERLCRDALADAGARIDHVEAAAIVAAQIVATSQDHGIADVVAQMRHSNPSWFRPQRASRG